MISPRLSLFLCCMVWFSLTLSAEAKEKDPIVVLISIDGLAGYYLDDPKAEMPAIREMMEKGAWAKRTEVAFPSITQTNHASLVTGVYPSRHGILANKLLDRESNEIILPHRHLASRVPPIYRRAHEEGLKVAVISWPGAGHEPQTSWKHSLPDEAEFQILSPKDEPADGSELLAGSAAGAIRDDLQKAEIACRILEKNPPNLLVVRFSSTDTVQHNHGPQSLQAYSAVRTIDGAVGKILETIKKQGLEDRATVIVASDHGFLPYSRRVNLNALLREEGWWDGEGDPHNKVKFVSWSGAGFIYILDDAEKDRIEARLARILPKTEGVEEVIFEKDFSDYKFPTRKEDPHAPDVLLAAKPGYGFSGTPNPKNLISEVGSIRGAHGYLPSHHELSSTFVAWGAGIKAGQKLDNIRVVDVEPTISTLLGLKTAGGADGRVLVDILE